jgi:Xaa-Pro aminopeptidase
MDDVSGDRPIGVPGFSDHEMARRRREVRAAIDAQGLDGILVFGHSAGRRHSQADVYYLAGVAPFQDSYMLVTRGGDVVLWIMYPNHFASARATAVVDDVRRVEEGPAEPIAHEIKARGLKKIGLVGDAFHRRLDAIRAELPHVLWSDATGAYRRLRSCKSDEEIAFQKRAAIGCDAAMRAIGDAIKPGVEERDLLVLSEEVAWNTGCEPHFLYLNSTPMATSTSCVPNQHVGRRKLCMGDVINTELTISYGLYSAQILRPFFLGEPTSDYQRLYAVTKDVHDRVAALIRPGVDMKELHEASGIIESAGYTSVDDTLHGFAVDILPPFMRSRGFAPPAPYVIERNMTLVLQPNPTTHDELKGMQLGQTGLVTETGYQSMHALPSEVRQCG